MKISIITISFNSEKTIESTILSVLNQNYPNLEYIIVDGKSTDGTMQIINKYQNKINKIISEPDNGISDAFNKGIKLATGEIIGIINSDDFLNNDALKKISNYASIYPNYDVYYGNSIVFNENFNYIYTPTEEIDKIKLTMILSHPATFIRHSAYKEYGYYKEEYKCAMDFELLSRMYINGGKFKHIDEELTWFRLGGESQKKSKITKEESVAIALRNGITKNIAEKWYKKIYFKQRIKSSFANTKIESVLRKLLKKQEKTRDDSEWFLNK